MMVLRIDKLLANPAFRCGSKARNLCRLSEAGFSVPDGVAVSPDAFADHVSKIPGFFDSDRIAEVLAEGSVFGLEKLSDIFSERLDSVPLDPAFVSEMDAAVRSLGGKTFAVRSSGIEEDGASRAWAGQMDSFLNVPPEEVPSRIVDCWKSFFRPRALEYAFRSDREFRMPDVGVIVQNMAEGRVSGVAFSVNPVSGDDRAILVEASNGLDSGAISGKGIPDRYAIGKVPLRMLGIETDSGYDPHSPFSGSVGPVLGSGEVLELAGKIIAIERLFRVPCDVEWTYGPS